MVIKENIDRPLNRRRRARRAAPDCVNARNASIKKEKKVVKKRTPSPKRQSKHRKSSLRSRSTGRKCSHCRRSDLTSWLHMLLNPLPFQMATKGTNNWIVFTFWSLKCQQLGVFGQGLPASNKWSKLVQCSEALDSPGYSDFLYMKSISSPMRTTFHTTVHPPAYPRSPCR